MAGTVGNNESRGSTTEHEKALTEQVEKLKEENLQLMRDIENICFQNSGSMFSTSYVVSDRIYSLETELTKTKRELKQVKAERDSLAEDTAELRKAKRNVDCTWRSERSKNESLEKEVEFYQEQSVKAFSERDEALAELEAAKSGSLNLEQSLRDAVSRADEQSRLRQELERRLEQSQNEVASLTSRVEQLSKLSAVKDELDVTKRRLDAETERRSRVEEALDELQTELTATKELLDKERGAAGQLKDSMAGLKARHEKEIADHLQEADSLRGLLASAESAADEADTTREEFEDSLFAARAEVENARRAASDAERRCTQAEQQRDSARQELERAREDFLQEARRISSLEEQCSDLKTRLANATQEKVSSMMQLADMKQENARLLERLQGSRRK
mmetsp:Transcript_26289/g.62486  ORF Transcript_26289/g.62486 Transcript_26289/m.62486 type:complete len:393 (-) Transcript_26289:80-1258(-)